MNAFHCLTIEPTDKEEIQEQDLPKELENDCFAIESVDKTGKPFETPKHEIRKISKTKNKALKLAKQKRIEAWQLAKQKRMEAWQLAEKQAQSKLIEFENNAKKGISVSLTENYTDIILNLLHIIHKDKPLSEIEKIFKTFIEKLKDYWNECIWKEMDEAAEEEEYNNMEQMQDMELASRGIFWCEETGSYYS